MYAKALGSWIILGIALVAWVAGGWWAYQIDKMVSDREAQLQANSEQHAKDVAALRMRALTAETAADRAKLLDLVKIDVVEAAKQIESAGVPAGVKFRVRDAALDAVPAKQVSPLQPVSFSVDADGSFEQLLRSIALLRSLPFPLQIAQLDLSRVPSSDEASASKTPQWHATLRLRLLTIAPLPS